MEFTLITSSEWDSLPSVDVPYAETPYAEALTPTQYGMLAVLCCDVEEGTNFEDFDPFYKDLYFDSVETASFMKNETFRSVIERLYRHMIAAGDGRACCNLGNMYHDGADPSSHDYTTAVELYRLGGQLGDDQSLVNLGYAYYYGRSVERDYVRAYQCFAHAALIGKNAEAFWKLGDLYASGKGVDQSDASAWQFYHKAYDLAGHTPLAARPAHHIADYLLSGIKGKVEPDPATALCLYAEAEVGYYDLIDSGLDYYQRQLEQVIEGQARAREAVRQARSQRLVDECPF